ncbi:MAG: response regulator [Bacteroidia bacterium]|nr:response regulator [Bacteroidia bacterium]
MNQPQILIVDDNPVNVRVAAAALEEVTTNILSANSGERALTILERVRPDLILMDVNMPGLDGYETVRRIKAKPEIADIPVIFLTAQDDVSAKVEGFDAGGVDYVVKPFQHREIVARVQTHVKVHTLTRELAKERRAVMDSIQYARRIQRAMLPKEEQIQARLPESFVLFRPKSIVSGDFFCFFDLDPWAILVFADCTGHGVPGALMSVVGMASLQKIVQERGVHDPPAILEELDVEVRKLLNQDEEGGNDGMDAVVIAVQPTRKILYYAAAMRSFYRVRNGEATEFKGDKVPVGGAIYGEKRFTGGSVPIEAGDTFYLASDGFTDQFGGEEGRKYMAKNFLTLLAQIAALPIAEQPAALDEEFDRWRGDHPQTDDVTVIGFRIP